MASPGSMPFQNSSMLQFSALATAKRLPAEILLAPSSHFFNCDQETPTAFASPLLDTPENSRMRRMFEPMITSTSLAGFMLFMAAPPSPLSFNYYAARRVGVEPSTPLEQRITRLGDRQDQATLLMVTTYNCP